MLKYCPVNNSEITYLTAYYPRKEYHLPRSLKDELIYLLSRYNLHLI
jgi:hypothetical protein